MEHSDAEIPQEQSAIVTDAAEAVRLLVAPPRIERDPRYPRVVALAASDQSTFRHGPDRHEIILSAGQDVFAVGGPAHANDAAVVAAEDVENPEHT